MATDIEAWRAFVADCQAAATQKAARGLNIITVRICVQDGALTDWSPPHILRWHSERQPWAKGKLAHTQRESS